jgi:isopentenyl phosphate kinase
MFGWLWSDKIAKSLLQRSNVYLDRHFVPAIHEDLVVAQHHLHRIFGGGLSTPIQN